MRRRALLQALLAAGCGAHPKPAPARIETPLLLDPLSDLAPAAGLAWILVLEPPALVDALPALHAVVAPARFALFAARHGGIDPRAADAIVIAGYPQTTLALVLTPLDPARVERAFTQRAIRAERSAGAAPDIVRASGEVGSAHEDLLILGQRAVGLSVGARGPLRAAELFALGKLRRASPAFRSPPLDRAAEVLGASPARLFFPGPFSGDAAKGLGGLLGAATAVGVAARVEGGLVHVRISVLGVDPKDAHAATLRLLATYDRIADSGVGRLCGLDHPKTAPAVGQEDDALTLTVTLDAMAVGKGLYDATQADVSELMKL